MVVVNGGDYDEWAAKLAASSAPTRRSSMRSTGGAESTAEEGHQDGHDGANPHALVQPRRGDRRRRRGDRGTQRARPEAADYFAERRTAFTTTLKPYDELIDEIKAARRARPTPPPRASSTTRPPPWGWSTAPRGLPGASANETDPSPADMDAFLRRSPTRVDVLIYNTQTEGSMPQQIRAAAEQAGVPVVDVTETVPPGATSFEAWQVDQLTALAKALGVPA